MVHHYELAAIPFALGNPTGPKSKSKNEDRQRFRQGIIRQWMGDAKFDALQRALRDAGFTDFAGDPDLFCWHPKTGEWFFAEAKGPTEKFTANQEKWFSIARQAILGVEIRTYRLVRSQS